MSKLKVPTDVIHLLKVSIDGTEFVAIASQPSIPHRPSR